MIILDHDFIYSVTHENSEDAGWYRCYKCELVIIKIYENCYYAPSRGGIINKILDVTCDEILIKKLLE